MSALTGLIRQARFDLLIFRRNPAATFFTVVLPLIFLFIFTSIFGNEEIRPGVRAATFYVPGILALSIISATATNLAITMTTRRERGVLKRVRGTPIPAWTFVLSQALAGLVLCLIMTALIVLIGWIVFDVSLNASGIPSLLISVVLGALSFAAIGLALTSIIPSEDAAPAVTNAVFLPLYFVSDVFIVSEDTPGFIRLIGDIFPVKHLSNALQESFDPFADGAPWPWQHWLVIAAWGIVCAAITMRTFRWTPNR